LHHGASGSLGLPHEHVVSSVGDAGPDPVDRQQQGAVVKTQLEHRRVDSSLGQHSLELLDVTHRRPSPESTRRK
jgi:hypothetical protein